MTNSVYGEHTSGTKFYELCLVRRDDNAVLIRRYDALNGAGYKGKTLVQSGSFAAMRREFDALVRKKRDYKLSAGNVQSLIQQSGGTRPASEVLKHYENTSNYRAIQEAFLLNFDPAGVSSREEARVAATSAAKLPPIEGWGEW